MNKQDVADIFKAPGEKQQRALIEKLAKGHEAMKWLIELWDESKSTELKRWVAEALGEFNQPECKKRIVAALKDEAMSVKLHAIFAIKKLGDREFGRNLLMLISDKSGGIRMNALDAIYGMRVQGYQDFVEKCLTDEKEYIRKRARLYTESKDAKPMADPGEKDLLQSDAMTLDHH